MRVLVTASRDWSDERSINLALTQEYVNWKEDTPDDTEFVVVHGKCRGGDILADRWAKKMHQTDPRVRPEEHPADWERYGTAAGHIRNQEMLDTTIDRVLGFRWSEKSPGTKGCVKMAKRMGIVVKEFHPPKLW